MKRGLCEYYYKVSQQKRYLKHHGRVGGDNVRARERECCEVLSSTQLWGHELIATLVTCTRSSQQDQSALWQAPVGGLGGLPKRKGARKKESKRKEIVCHHPKLSEKGNATTVPATV